MSAEHQHFYLTRKFPTSLEETFAITLREDFSVVASPPKWLVCFRGRQRGHHTAVCRAPDPVLAASDLSVNAAD
ncbi:unnamed protein product [Peronospora belbahrii]|uniref:Uncharacterized protein n=1 Tax=Peronospora belbahrii TaxID=622444 RepID=A0AAU9L327_9STRA|nr:unnamed protein product [Peronospora belbahrii]